MAKKVRQLQAVLFSVHVSKWLLMVQLGAVHQRRPQSGEVWASSDKRGRVV